MDFNSKLLLLGCCIILQQFANIVEAAEEEWDYGKNGPQTPAWCKVSEVCCSETQMQSPINLDLKLAKVGVTSAFNFIDYDKYLPIIGVNNGHTAMFSQDPKSVWQRSPRPRISGGGLNGTYTFHSMHFHWGKDNSKGSEHFDNGFQYPNEGHLVHYRSDFANLGDATASGQPDALAVLGVFYAVGEVYNKALDDLTLSLEAINTPFRPDVRLKKYLRLIDVLPYNKVSIYRYMGSLTTPNCNEVVVWTVFTTPQYLSYEQMNRFRQLYDESKARLVNNFRPLQDLGKRVLYRLEAKSGGNIDNIIPDDELENMSAEYEWP